MMQIGVTNKTHSQSKNPLHFCFSECCLGGEGSIKVAGYRLPHGWHFQVHALVWLFRKKLPTLLVHRRCEKAFFDWGEGLSKRTPRPLVPDKKSGHPKYVTAQVTSSNVTKYHPFQKPWARCKHEHTQARSKAQDHHRLRVQNSRLRGAHWPRLRHPRHTPSRKRRHPQAPQRCLTNSMAQSGATRNEHI